MPKNKKEGLIFTTLMCFMMVFGMSLYNLWLHHAFSLENLLGGLVPGFVVAFILDTVVVGVLAKKIAFKLPFVHKKPPLSTILTISCLMIIGMVTCMSLFGLVMEGGMSSLSTPAYLKTWGMNFVVALPYQLLVVGPSARFVLKKVQTAA